MIYNPISDLFNSFFKKEIHPTDLLPKHGVDSTIATTIRLPADVKNYYERMALHSRSTTQSVMLQVLGGVMEGHIGNQASTHARILADRFFAIFSSHGIKIHDIPKFLNNFNITIADLTDDSKVVQLLNNEMIDFLAVTFNLNKNWIMDGSSSSHTSFHCYKALNTWLSLLQHTEKPIKLKVFFDQDILKNPKIGNVPSHNDRHVKFVLTVEEEINGVKYQKPYQTEALNWDYQKANNHIYGLIEGMNISQQYSERTIQKFAGNFKETMEQDFVMHVLDDFKCSDTSFKYSDIASLKARSSKNDFNEMDNVLNTVKEREKAYFKQNGDKVFDYHSIERDLETLRNKEFKSVLSFVRR